MMKIKSSIVGLLLVGALSLMTIGSFTGCQHTPKVSTVVDPVSGATTTVTNDVTTVDPVKLEAVRKTLAPSAARAVAKAIARSPQHAAEIKTYALALSGIFCQMQANKNFSLAYLTDAANKATLDLQSTLVSDPDLAADLAAGKDTLLGLFELEAASDLTWKLPNNVWLDNVCGLICDVITKAIPAN